MFRSKETILKYNNFIDFSDIFTFHHHRKTRRNITIATISQLKSRKRKLRFPFAITQTGVIAPKDLKKHICVSISQ